MKAEHTRACSACDRPITFFRLPLDHTAGPDHFSRSRRAVSGLKTRISR